MTYVIIAKIAIIGILARITSISTKETAIVSIAWLFYLANPLDASVSEPRFTREI